MKQTKVKIEVTLEQAKIIKDSLDWTARTSMGQMESSFLPGDIESQLCGDYKTDENWLYRRDLWDKFANAMKGLLHPDLSSYSSAYKSFSHSEFCRNCCSINKMLAVKLQEFEYKDIKEKPFNVNSSFTDIYDVPQAKVEIN